MRVDDRITEYRVLYNTHARGSSIILYHLQSTTKHIRSIKAHGVHEQKNPLRKWLPGTSNESIDDTTSYPLELCCQSAQAWLSRTGRHSHVCHETHSRDGVFVSTTWR